jgi:leader peptidase (prepilin peptidase) / N-methyltransferase
LPDASILTGVRGEPLIAAALAAVLGALVLFDLRRGRLPDWLTLPLAAAGLLHAWREGALLASAIGCAAGFVLFAGLGLAYRRARGRAGLGGGDVKLAAAAGAWVGWQGLPGVVLLAAGAALALAVVRGRAEATEPVPFGAYLAPAILLVWLSGPLV